MEMGTDTTTTLSKTQASQDTENVQKQHSHDEQHQEQRHGEEEEGKRVDDHLEVTDKIGVRDGGDELAKFGVLACHRTMASTTPDLHSNPWGPVTLPRPLRLTLHLGARHFLNASIASDAFDSTYQTHETTDGLQSTKNCKVHPNQLHQTEHHAFTTCSLRVLLRVPHVFPRVYHVFTTCLPRVHHVFTTCSPRVPLRVPHVFHVFTTCSTCLPRIHLCSPRVHHHVFTTCSPRVYHVFTTCSPRVHHVFTTCSPRVHHVFTTCSPRVHHVFTTCSPRVHHVYTTCSPRVALGLVNQVTERDEGVVDRDHIHVQRHEARAFQCDRTT